MVCATLGFRQEEKKKGKKKDLGEGVQFKSKVHKASHLSYLWYHHFKGAERFQNVLFMESGTAQVYCPMLY
jgi:hypothetical protein